MVCVCVSPLWGIHGLPPTCYNEPTIKAEVGGCTIAVWGVAEWSGVKVVCVCVCMGGECMRANPGGFGEQHTRHGSKFAAQPHSSCSAADGHWPHCSSTGTERANMAPVAASPLGFQGLPDAAPSLMLLLLALLTYFLTV